MAEKRISEYTALTSVADGDELTIVDKSDTSMSEGGTNKKVTRKYLLGNKSLPSGDFIGTEKILDEDDMASDSETDVASQQSIKAYVLSVLNSMYPVGSIYVNASVSTNPATLLGFGTWTAFGAGRVMVGLDSGQTEFDTLGETGGSKTHTLTVDEMPEHSHSYTSSATIATGDYISRGEVATSTRSTDSSGGGEAHNNLQPYIVVYMWKRTE